MADTIYAKGEGGVVWEFDLPLSEPFADQLAKGTLVRCNKDGSPLPAEAPDDDPADDSPTPGDEPDDDSPEPDADDSPAPAPKSKGKRSKSKE